MEKEFNLKLINQHWLGNSIEQHYDLTSHGNILLEISGQDISGCQYSDSDLGINQSAVALLNSVLNDHIPEYADNRISEPIFYHGCSIMSTCPNRIIDFRVRHNKEGIVTLDCFYVTGNDLPEPKKYYDLKVTLPNVEYAKQVLEFAEQALKFLPKDKKGDKWEVDLYKSNRKELANLIKKIK
jgi:hypothetical protein